MGSRFGGSFPEAGCGARETSRVWTSTRSILEVPGTRRRSQRKRFGPQEDGQVAGRDKSLQKMTDKIVVLSTCNSAAQAELVARALVEQRLAACVNIVPGIRSIYRWKDQVEDAVEWMLVIKSRRDLMDELRLAIGKIHAYEVPELLALPVVGGAENYIAWLDRELRPGRNSVTDA